MMAVVGKANLEVVNQGLHALFHGCAWRGNELVVIHLDCAGRHLVQALYSTYAFGLLRGHKSAITYLVNNAERLPELLNTAEIPVVAIAVLPNWNIELDLHKNIGTTSTG